jgi:hypothetical protein
MTTAGRSDTHVKEAGHDMGLNTVEDRGPEDAHPVGFPDASIRHDHMVDVEVAERLLEALHGAKVGKRQ